MSADPIKPVLTDNLPGRIKVLEADAFLTRLEESGVKNHYLFRVRAKDKVIEAAKGVKPLTPEGRAILEITPESYRTRIKKNIGNVGCYAFPDGLCFMDFDLDPANPGSLVVPFNKILELVETFNTFCVRTRSGGYQFYFKNPSLEENPHIYYVPPGHQDGEPLVDAGELRCKNQYVVAPGSFVPKEGKKGFTEDANGVYQVIWDMPIQTLDLADLPEWLKIRDPVKESLQKNKKEHRVTVNVDTTRAIEPMEDSTILNSRGISLAKLRSKDEVLDDLLMGEEHVNHFRSPSEADFSVISKLLRKNFTHQQIYDIMITHRPRSKTKKDTYIQDSIANAAEYINAAQENYLSKGCTDLPIIIIDSLPKTLPSYHVTLLKTGPRTGKTHTTIEWAIQSKSANYMAATHETVENALNIFRRIIKDHPESQDLLAVHVAGKDYTGCCNEKDLYENCQHCPKFPHVSLEADQVGISYMELKQSAQELLREKKILTPKDVPQEMCPYYTLHLAEEVADICFTVPYFHYTNDKIKMIHPRHLLIVDEDTTTRGHYPSCVELAVEYRVKDEYSIRNIILKEMMRFIDKLEKKVTEQGKGPKKDRHTPTNTIILNLISKINQVNTYLKSATDNNSPESIAAMHENISSIDLSNNLEDLAKIRVINKVDEYARELGMAHSNAALLFEPLLYPAQSRFEEGMCPATLTWIGGNSTPATLFAIADHTLIHVPKFEKLVVIGGTEAELFVKDVTEKLQIDKNDVKTIVLQEFKYANNYVFFEIYDPDGANKQKYNNDEENEEIQILPTEESIEDSKTLDATRYFRKFLYLFSEENRKYLQQTPYLLLTSTIKSQNNLTSWLGGGSIACTDHRINEIHTNHSTGRINVFYQNSIISRGLDVPMYHGTFVYSCNFATPYWTAMKNYFKDLLLQPAEDGADQDAEQKKFDLIKEKIDEYSNIIRRIQMDETTNGILRTAPIPGQYEDHIKIVVYTERHKGLVSGAQYNGTTIIPIPTTARIEPLISVFKRLVDPVLTKEAPGVPAAQHLPHPFHKSTIEEAKNLITQYMNNYEDAVEAYNLPMERVGQEILLQPYLFKGNRLSETALIKYLQGRTQNRIPRKTIKRVVLRLAEENILKSSMSTFKEMCTINRAGDLSQSEMATVDDGKSSQGLHRMYYINQELLSQLTLSDDNARKEIVQSLLTKF